MSATLTKTMRGSFWAALLVLCALLLSACGAAVNTDLNLKDANSGSRVIKVVLEKSDGEEQDEYVKGGNAAIDASIKNNLPDELEYSGISSEGENDVATFTLNFDSISQYTEKAQALLDASGIDKTAEIQIANSETGLVTGTTVEENFTSKDLLGWIPDALVADGVIDENDENSVFNSDGETNVTFAGEKLKVSNSGSGLRVADVKDNGFSSLFVDAQMQGNGEYAGTVYLGTGESIGSVQEKQISEYFNGVLPEGAELKNLSDVSTAVDSYSVPKYGKAVTFTAANTSEFSEKLGKILGSDQTTFEETSQSSSENPTLLTTTFTGSLNCLAICSPNASEPVFELTTPDGWNFVYDSSGSNSSSASDTSTGARATDSPFVMNFEHSIPLQAASVNTDITLSGGAKSTFTYIANTADVAQVGDGFKSFLAPAEGQGTFEETEEDGRTTFTAVIEGDSAEEYTSKISTYIPNASLQINREEGFHLWPDYGVNLNLPLSESKLAGGVAGGFRNEITVPAFNSFAKTQPGGASSETQIDGRTAKIEQESYSAGGALCNPFAFHA